MNRKLFILPLLTLSFIGLTGCKKADNNTPVEPPIDDQTKPDTGEHLTSVEFTQTDLLKNVCVGDSGGFHVNTNLKDEKGCYFKYESSDKEVLYVTKNGKYSAVKAGTVTVTVKVTREEESATASIEVTVIQPNFDHIGAVGTSFEHEFDETDPYITFEGEMDLIYKKVFDSSWYFEVSFILNSTDSDDDYTKVGIRSVSPEEMNGLYYYFDTPRWCESNWNLWGDVGIVANKMGQGLAYKDQRDGGMGKLSEEQIGKASISYGDKFSMGLLRDGGVFYYFFNGHFVDKMDCSYFLDEEELSEPRITAYKVHAKVSDWKHYTKDSQEFANLKALGA